MRFFVRNLTIILFSLFITGINVFAADIYKLDDYLDEMWTYSEWGGTNGGSFDMKNSMPWDPYAKIKSLTIAEGTWNNMYCITGIGVVWNDNNTFSAGKFGGNSTTIEFDEDEYIEKMTIGQRGHSNFNNDYVTFIGFWTTNGDYYEFGGAWQSAITMDFTERGGRHPVAFYGRSGTIIDSLGVYGLQRINLVPQYVNLLTDEQTIFQAENGALIKKGVVNAENTTQQTTISAEIRKTNSFTKKWMDTTSVSGTVGVTMEKEVSFLGLSKVKASIKAEITTMGSWAKGEDETDSTWVTLSATESLTMSPYSIHAVVTGLFTETADVPFEYVYKNSFDERQFILTGSFSDILNGASASYFLEIGYYDPETYECVVSPEWEGQFTIFCPTPNTYAYDKAVSNTAGGGLGGVTTCIVEAVDPENLPEDLIMVDGDVTIIENNTYSGGDEKLNN
ncbi:MAG: hypothetical protein GY710_15125 [Desulfobacteraceae bacterium]|nr:hypothetical protein [Desulfobacteraceae bacterium]